jgi:hypothetical protein
MSDIEHVAKRPTWECKSCTADWPYDQAGDVVTGEYVVHQAVSAC